MSELDESTVATRLDDVRRRIARAGGDPDATTVVAVTKGMSADAVRAALAAGLEAIGESYAQELVAKADDLVDDELERALHWHFIGRVQRNKVRRVAGLVDLWHSVDRLSLGAAIADASPGAAVLVQVNTAGDEHKAGCPPKLAPSIVEGLHDLGLDVRGLMTIAPFGDPELARPAFRALRALADGLGLVECSMGMSNDLEVAVEEGATIVRIGTALFGPRRSETAVEH